VCGVCERDCKSSVMRTPWPTGGCSVMVQKKKVTDYKTGVACSRNGKQKIHTEYLLEVFIVDVTICKE